MNNFDMSSAGVNLELTCRYDCDLAYCDFTDCFLKDEHALTDYRSDDVYHYVDYGNIEALDLSSIESYNATKADILAIYNGFEVCNIFGATFDLKACASEYLDKPFSRLSKDDLIEGLEAFLPKEVLVSAYRKYLRPLYEIVAIRGYSQGDYAEVVVPDSYWELISIEKTEEAIADLRKHLKNLFYDAPIRCVLTIDGEELYLDEYFEDIYRYDADEVLEIANGMIKHDKKAYILEWLADNLPEYPDYR